MTSRIRIAVLKESDTYSPAPVPGDKEIFPVSGIFFLSVFVNAEFVRDAILRRRRRKRSVSRTGDNTGSEKADPEHLKNNS